ncbi:hypothetical protein [Actinomadura fibrosa]|uniref:Uncharacterized protein n=1 Tax=Actinomadura fibrosa TaxID=111802 RepID=A0ABW2XHN8_9ACTN|nr:hypothetical protein [Actinomadura fibrosa]
MPEDDFGLWERELDPGPQDDGTSSGLGMVVVAGLTASGCTAMIALGEVPLGAAGLVVSSIILLLWRVGM